MRGQRKNPRKAVQPFENKKRKIDIFKNYEANGVEKIQRKLEIFSTLISKKSTNKIQPMNRGKLFVIFDGKHCIVTIVWLHPQEFFDRATVLPLPYVTAGDDVLEYLRDSIREYLAQSYELRVLMPENELATIREKIPNGAEKVFHEYFVLQEEKSHRALRQQFTYGAIPLAYGCLFMILCMVFRQFFFGFPEDSFFNAVREGLLVIGWVAL